MTGLQPHELRSVVFDELYRAIDELYAFLDSESQMKLKHVEGLLHQIEKGGRQ
jgi:hypothetical protein